jgi:hypothetical protein
MVQVLLDGNVTDTNYSVGGTSATASKRSSAIYGHVVLALALQAAAHAPLLAMRGNNESAGIRDCRIDDRP